MCETTVIHRGVRQYDMKIICSFDVLLFVDFVDFLEMLKKINQIE